MTETQDTEVLLALLSSLLRSPVNDQELLLDALVQSNGDVEKAARLLESSAHCNGVYTSKVSEHRLNITSRDKVKSSAKRKRETGLDGWLKSPEKTANDADESERSRKTPRSRIRRSMTPERLPRSVANTETPDFVQGSSRPNASPVKVKSVSKTEFLSLLRPLSSTEVAAKPIPSKYPPLTLTTPELVAKHTPCTMHMSVLPPELACRRVSFLCLTRC